MKMHIWLSFIFSFVLFGSITPLEPERSAVYVMNQQLVWIRDHSRYEDTAALKTLFESYPKEFDTKYKWPEVMKILKDYEFIVHSAKYISFDTPEDPTEISGNVTFHVANESATVEVRLQKDMRSTTEWKIENPKKPNEFAAMPWTCWFTYVFCVMFGLVPF